MARPDQERRSPPGRAAGFRDSTLERPTVSAAGHLKSTAAIVDLPPAALHQQRRRLPFQREVEQVIASGRQPNVYLFAGADAWDRASRRRFQHRPGSALVMPADVAPEAVAWPARLDACCIHAPTLSRVQALEIAQAAVTGGVRLVVALGHDFMVRRSG